MTDVKDFLELLESYTSSQEKTLMMLRTVGPDSVTDQDKANQIYSLYYQNLNPESPLLFDRLLYNEFTFVEFETEKEAYDFAIHNFPVDETDDSDYFVHCFVFSNGNLAYTNTSLKSLSTRVSQ
jgi:hypothetical protein